jgi:polysaccharide pyruvyl transferase WcaK-like protein
MKAGILTFHRAENFGATLQVFALQKIIENFGADVEIIDYRCPNIENSYKIFKFPNLFERKNVFVTLYNFLQHILSIRFRRIKKQKYHDFWRKHLKISASPILSPNEIPTNYNLYICGSDQVFNFSISGNDKIFFGEFEVVHGSKKVSYAASMEYYCFKDIERNSEKYRKLLANFDKISVRENILAEKLQPLYNEKIQVVLDPTFLVEKNVFEDIATNLNMTEKYVLIYHLRWTKEAIEIAQKIADEKKLKIIQVYAGFKAFIKGDEHKQNLGPEELLSYIINADFIITTSFHGTALSLIFEKQFFVLALGSHTRQRNLLKDLGIEQRMIKGVNELDVNELIDYESVNIDLKKLKESSLNFLKECLIS